MYFDLSLGFQTESIALYMATGSVHIVGNGLDKCNGVVFDASGKIAYV